MPLSEREQRILEDIERSLTAQDPSFLEGADRRSDRPRPRDLKLGALLFVVGLVMLIAFFVLRVVVLGVGAFGAMVAGMVVAAGAFRGFKLPSGHAAWDQSRRRIGGRFDTWERRLRERYRRR